MFQIIFNKLSAAEMAALPKTLQLDLLAEFQILPEDLDNLDASKPADESYYRDSRNVGLWAKKRAKQMGVDLGPKFDETVEKARTGKLIKEME